MALERDIKAGWLTFTRHIDILELQNAFGLVVRQAVLAERERCAQIAESFIPSGFPGNFGIARDDRARTIAAAIRRQADE